MKEAYNQALADVTDDLVRTSSQSAPHDEGILETAWSKEISPSPTKPIATVSYTVREASSAGNFNYALKMHEGGYELGEKSVLKTGGTGMSGKTYDVGAGYLGGVLQGETVAYRGHIERAVERATRNFS